MKQKAFENRMTPALDQSLAGVSTLLSENCLQPQGRDRVLKKEKTFLKINV